MDNSNLKNRLENIWEAPNFTDFLKRFTKRAPFRIKKGNVIFFEGDQPERIYFIKRGFVKLYRTSPEGRSTIIHLYGPGTMLAIRALTSKDKRLKHTAEAITDVEVITVPEKDYFAAIEQNPQYLIDLLHVFIQRLDYTERKLEGFILTDTTARVASFLYDLALRFGKRKDGTITIPLSLTHQLIAEFVGTFRETVTVAINRLKRDGILKDEKAQITILDIKKLKTQALMDSDSN